MLRDGSLAKGAPSPAEHTSPLKALDEAAWWRKIDVQGAESQERSLLHMSCGAVTQRELQV